MKDKNREKENKMLGKRIMTMSYENQNSYGQKQNKMNENDAI